MIPKRPGTWRGVVTRAHFAEEDVDGIRIHQNTLRRLRQSDASHCRLSCSCSRPAQPPARRLMPPLQGCRRQPGGSRLVLSAGA